MDINSALWLIPALPLLGFLVNGLVGSKLPNPAVAAIAIAGPAISFALSVWAFLSVHHGLDPAATYFQWIATGGLDLGFALQVDALTAVMLLNVTGIGSLIHLYSYGYMHHDESFARFMAYLNLFMSAMLILVMGANLPMMFVGWEGVGLCSYLLIGFWYSDFANVDAGRKAFVVNRIGDLAFLVGMFALYSLSGSLDYSVLGRLQFAELTQIVPTGAFTGWQVGEVMRFAALCLFIGATGKSAQIPLYIWLPDAMAGPTPVSALIHAATMVTAGVYMVGRLDFLYVHSPDVMALIAVVSATTAFVSGAIAFSQNDIKKVLAYSTVSQLGFMFVGMATANFSTGIFHVLTHAFFKALLFLGAGAVIVAMHHEQDIRKMGGLRKDIPLIFGLFLIGSLALAGVPPFAGFWSKDEILGGALYQAMAGGGAAWWYATVALMVTALMTAFYTTRLVMLTFFGEPADPHRHVHHVHWTMIAPLVVLALLSIVGGFGLAGNLEHFLSVGFPEPKVDEHLAHTAHLTAMGLSVAVVVLGVGSGAFLYGAKRDLVDGFVNGAGAVLHKASLNKFYVDEFYEATVVNPISKGAHLAFKYIDREIIDHILVEGAGAFAYDLGGLLRRTQVGVVSAATTAMLLGSLAMMGYVIFSGVLHG